MVDGTPPPLVEPFGLMDGLPEEVLAEARGWERHVVEVETGLPPGAEPGKSARAEYDPAARTLVQRTEVKAAELGVGYRTVERMRAQYAQQGLWGLVDQRLVRPREATGRVDARLVVARQVIEAETHVSTGTRGRLIRRVVEAVEDAYGKDVVPLPGRSTFYKLVDALSTGRHTFGSAVTRRQAANRPDGPFTARFAARPGEQVQIDSTPIDVMVLLESGMPARADLTIAVDVATRTICAGVLRPVGTKAMDDQPRRRHPDRSRQRRLPHPQTNSAAVGVLLATDLHRRPDRRYPRRHQRHHLPAPRPHSRAAASRHPVTLEDGA